MHVKLTGYNKEEVEVTAAMVLNRLTEISPSSALYKKYQAIYPYERISQGVQDWIDEVL